MTVGKLSQVERRLLELEAREAGRMIRAGLGGTTLVELTPQWIFPAIPTEGAQIIFMISAVWNDMLGKTLPARTAYDSLWWSQVGDAFWKPAGGKCVVNAGRPGTFNTVNGKRS